jgi:hypothetical protein
LFGVLLQNETYSCTEMRKVGQYNQTISYQAVTAKANREDTFEACYIDNFDA